MKYIREAERRLSAAAARIGVVRADLYPRVNLGGAVGLLTGNFVTTASPLISWAFPNQASARARIEQARATERAALASWDVAVLRALREVETALATYGAEARRLHNRLDEALSSEDRAIQLHAIEAASAQSHELLDIFAALLRIAEVEGLGLRAQFGDVALSDLVDGIVETYRPDMEAAGDHILVAEITPDITVAGDQRLLQQLLTNLVGNVLTHTPSGTAIKVTLERTADSIRWSPTMVQVSRATSASSSSGSRVTSGAAPPLVTGLASHWCRR